MITLVLFSLVSATVLLAGVPAVAFALALESCSDPGAPSMRLAK